MIYVRIAKIYDIPGVNALLGLYSLVPITSDFINKKDLSIVAVNELGQIVGFLFCGLMAKGKVGYVDYYTIHPEYATRGVADTMSEYLKQEFKKRGIVGVCASIAQNEFHDKSVSGAIKLGLTPQSIPHTSVIGVFNG